MTETAGMILNLIFDGANANIKINGEKSRFRVRQAKIDCVLFGLWGKTPRRFTLTICSFTKNDGQPVIRADKKGGTVKYGDKIYLNSNVSGADIYYTLDGTEPDETSNLYDGNGIAITDNDVVIKAYGVNGGVSGRVFTFGSYTLEAEDGVIFHSVNFSESASSLDAEFFVYQHRGQ
ncbi:MAG: chitobiase/beta-hexosaminidase C-terminal domain-containing protein [Clostridiales bacterium]|nr:MAG: chitobiase/beta-hexosaminidase C-terminal domain-containing protein [Clostridiales bacterium]